MEQPSVLPQCCPGLPALTARSDLYMLQPIIPLNLLSPITSWTAGQGLRGCGQCEHPLLSLRSALL